MVDFRLKTNVELTSVVSAFTDSFKCLLASEMRAGHAVSSICTGIIVTVGATICVSVIDMQLRIIISPTIARNIIKAMMYRCGTDLTVDHAKNRLFPIAKKTLIFFFSEKLSYHRRRNRQRNPWRIIRFN